MTGAWAASWGGRGTYGLFLFTRRRLGQESPALGRSTASRGLSGDYLFLYCSPGLPSAPLWLSRVDLWRSQSLSRKTIFPLYCCQRAEGRKEGRKDEPHLRWFPDFSREKSQATLWRHIMNSEELSSWQQIKKTRQVYSRQKREIRCAA